MRRSPLVVEWDQPDTFSGLTASGRLVLLPSPPSVPATLLDVRRSTDGLACWDLVYPVDSGVAVSTRYSRGQHPFPSLARSVRLAPGAPIICGSFMRGQLLPAWHPYPELARLSHRRLTPSSILRRMSARSPSDEMCTACGGQSLVTISHCPPCARSLAQSSSAIRLYCSQVHWVEWSDSQG
jgi:hypothetical protein